MPLFDENEGAGKVLVLPNPPYYWQDLKKPLGEVHHHVEPRPGDAVIARESRELAAQLLDTMPDALKAAADEAYDTSARLGRELNELQAELATFSSPPPAGLSIEERGQRASRRIGLESYIEELRERQKAADQEASNALDGARTHVRYHSGAAALSDYTAETGAMEAECARLIERIAQRKAILMGAIGHINAYVPPKPVEPEAEPVKRKGFFNR